MKTLNKIFFAAIATMAMTACNNEIGEQQVNNSGIINFRMGIGTPSSSRITMEDNSYAATFAANDEVGVFVKDNNSYVNVKYTTKDGTNWDGGPINAPADEAVSYTFYAYHPYQESNNDARNITTTVATNQETEGYIKNDFLISTATTSKTTVDLPFDHALSLVEVRLTGTGAAEGATVSMLNVATGATIDLTTETEPTVTTTGESNNTVIMDALSGVSMKYRAIIPAQEIQANTPIFKIEVNNKTYNASFTSNVKFEKGKYLAMFITIGKEEGTAEVEITTGATINDWTEGDGGDVSVEEVPLISEFPSTIPAYGTNEIADKTSSTWFNIINPSYTTASVSVAETATATPQWQYQANITHKSIWTGSSSNANNWYTSVIGYYLIGGISTTESAVYELSFKAKGTNLFATEEAATPETQSATDIQIYVTCRNAAADGSFAIRNNTGTPTASNSTTNLNKDGSWKECKFYIHFDKIKTGSPTSFGESDPATSTTDDYAKIQIRINTTNKATADEPYLSTTLSITDVKLVPYVIPSGE